MTSDREVIGKADAQLAFQNVHLVRCALREGWVIDVTCLDIIAPDEFVGEELRIKVSFVSRNGVEYEYDPLDRLLISSIVRGRRFNLEEQFQTSARVENVYREVLNGLFEDALRRFARCDVIRYRQTGRIRVSIAIGTTRIEFLVLPDHAREIFEEV